MKKSFISVVFLLFAMTAAAQSSKDDDAIHALIDRMTSAQLAYDSKTLDAILTADYIEISPLGEFDPRDKVLGFYSAEAKAAAGPISGTIETSDHSIRVYGKFAVAIVALTYKLTNDDKPLPPRSIRATYVLRKEGKDWKVASAQYTGIRPAQPKGKTN